MTRALGASEAQITADVARQQANAAKTETDWQRARLNRLIAVLVAKGVLTPDEDMEGGNR